MIIVRCVVETLHATSLQHNEIKNKEVKVRTLTSLFFIIIHWSGAA